VTANLLMQFSSQVLAWVISRPSLDLLLHSHSKMSKSPSSSHTQQSHSLSHKLYLSYLLPFLKSSTSSFISFHLTTLRMTLFRTFPTHQELLSPSFPTSVYTKSTPFCFYHGHELGFDGYSHH
jgi:hypothetical protein